MREPTVVVDGKEMHPEDIGLTAEEARELGHSLASISVHAVKR